MVFFFSDQRLVLLNLELSKQLGKLQIKLMHHAQKASSYLVPLEDMEVMNN